MSGGKHSPDSSGGQSSDQCDSIHEQTRLTSPIAEVLRDIKPDDVLEVVAQTREQTEVLVALHQGRLAGGILATKSQRILECIRSGNRYEAQVVGKVEGGSCTVLLRWKGNR